jgi:hypothetical protein
MGLPPGIYILLKKQSRYSRHFRYRLISLFVQARSDSFRASIATQGHRGPFRRQFNKRPLRRVADLSVARMTQELSTA